MALPVTSLWSGSHWLELFLKLVAASIIGGAIGWDRQARGKAAGLRTHMLVCLGAALFVMIPLELNPSSQEAASRAIQGVATGVGFLGAGEIVHQTRETRSSRKPEVKGLTSAAAIWVTAALGMVVACGLWQVGLMGTLLTMLILSGAKRLEQRISVVDDED